MQHMARVKGIVSTSGLITRSRFINYLPPLHWTSSIKVSLNFTTIRQANYPVIPSHVNSVSMSGLSFPSLFNIRQEKYRVFTNDS